MGNGWSSASSATRTTPCRWSSTWHGSWTPADMPGSPPCSSRRSWRTRESPRPPGPSRSEARAAEAWPSVAGEEAALELAHRRLFLRLRMIPAADVERPVGHEESELVPRVPADVAGLAATAGGGLVHGPFDRHDHVAQVHASAGREREGCLRTLAPGPAARRIVGLARVVGI